MGKNTSLFSVKNSGFTLIELLVVIGMMAALATIFIGILDPIEQYNRSNDAKRESELNQVKVALDSYYNDTGCYPSTLQFGVPWVIGNTTYFKKLPEDPQCTSDSAHCYLYQTDGSDCPQWNVLYASLRSHGAVSSTNKILCPLELMNQSCVPTDYGRYSSGYNFCIVSGNVSVSCQAISNNPLPVQSTQGNTPISPTPTPTPTPAIAQSCLGMDATNPNYMRYSCNGTCQDAGQGNGYYCSSICEGVCPSQ